MKRDLIKKINKHKTILIKSLLFFIVIYFIVPFIFNMLTKNIRLFARYSFYSFPAYTIILLILFAVFNRGLLSKYKYKPTINETIIFSLLALLSFIGYYIVRFKLRYNLTNYVELVNLAWLLYLIGIIFIAAVIFGKELFKKTYTSLLLFSFATYFFFVISRTLWQLWDILSKGIAYIVNFILSIFFDTNFYTIASNGSPKLGIGNFYVQIGPGCSGIESLSMFMGLFLLLVVYEQKNLDWKKSSIVFLIGLAGTYFLNALRITLLIIIGTEYPNLAKGSFHSHVGWVLFTLFLLALLYLCYGWMRKK